jgi:hypothetical protein
MRSCPGTRRMPARSGTFEELGLNIWYTTILRTAVWLMVAASTPAHADRVGYSRVVDLWAETGTVRAEHHHDWSGATRDARWKMISTTKNPFSADNDCSYLRLCDKSDRGRIVSPSRAGAHAHLDFFRFKASRRHLRRDALEPLSTCCL